MSDILLLIIAIGFVITALGTIALYVSDHRKNQDLDRMSDEAKEVMEGINDQSTYYPNLQKFILNVSQLESGRKSTEEKPKQA